MKPELHMTLVEVEQGRAADVAPQLEAFAARAAHFGHRPLVPVIRFAQLVADALMSAAGNACGSEGLAFAGRAFHDMTRVAASPADVWRGILATNADFVDEAVRSFLARLPSANSLEDGTATDRLFADARRWRQALAEGGVRQ